MTRGEHKGYAVVLGPDGNVERDTITCFHCQRVVFIQPGADPSSLGGFCRVCMRHICGPCATQGSCRPFEKQLEQMEAKDRLLRSIGI